MLWIEKYRPTEFSGVLGQDHVTGRLRAFADNQTVPHLLLSGPHGTGKSIAVECLARVLYQEHWEENLSLFHAADLFALGKAYLEKDERYSHLYRRDASLLVNVKTIIRTYASIRPLDAPFKLMVFEDADAIPREVQHALRRIMERYSQTCRFVFCTTQPSGLIPAITSRCLPFYFTPIPDTLVIATLKNIRSAEAENRTACSDDEIELIAGAAQGDLRKATMLIEVAMRSGQPFDLLTFSESETRSVAAAAFTAMRAGDRETARRRIESLMIEYGLSGREVLLELREVVKQDYNDPRIACLLANTDSFLTQSDNEFIQLNALTVAIIARVFD